MEESIRCIREIIETVYRKPMLFTCVCDGVKVQPKRLALVHEIVMNYEGMGYQELRDKVYQYGSMVTEDHLMARQIFLWLTLLLERYDK